MDQGQVNKVAGNHRNSFGDQKFGQCERGDIHFFCSLQGGPYLPLFYYTSALTTFSNHPFFDTEMSRRWLVYLLRGRV